MPKPVLFGLFGQEAVFRLAMNLIDHNDMMSRIGWGVKERMQALAFPPERISAVPPGD